MQFQRNDIHDYVRYQSMCYFPSFQKTTSFPAMCTLRYIKDAFLFFMCMHRILHDAKLAWICGNKISISKELVLQDCFFVKIRVTFTIAGHLIIPYHIQLMLFRKWNMRFKHIYDYMMLNITIRTIIFYSVKYGLINAKYHSTYFNAKHCIIQGHFLRSIDFIKFSSETTLVINEKSILHASI